MAAANAERRIVVLGASADRSKFGNKAVRAYLDQGWTVFPVNPKGGPIEGLAACRSVGDVPRPVARVSCYLPPAILLNELDAVAALEPEEVWFNPGSDSAEVVERATALGLNVIQACSIVDQGVSPAQYD